MADTPYFLTSFDPNYYVQGSRDPLGLQTVWVTSGRRLIRHLSTVSTSVTDFKILCLARHVCTANGDTSFSNFFPFLYRFEQACAYARHFVDPRDNSFNGIERVRNMDSSKVRFPVSDVDKKCFLLSNQRSYGVYGKYFRPFTDIGMERMPQFPGVMENVINRSADPASLRRLIKRLFEAGRMKSVSVSKEELGNLSSMLKTRSAEENDFYISALLKTRQHEPGLQNSFYDLLCVHPELLPCNDSKNENFFTFLRTAKVASSDPDLDMVFDDVEYTEQILYPLHALFAYFLNERPTWTDADLEKDPFFQQGFNKVPLDRLILAGPTDRDDPRQSFNDWLEESISPAQRVRYLVQRNREVSERRGKLPWVREESGRFIILNKGARPPKEITQQVDSNFSYFIPSYLGLFTELKAAPPAGEA